MSADCFNPTKTLPVGSAEHRKLIHDRVSLVVNTDVKFSELCDHYTKWSEEYDRDMNTWGYKSPNVAASLVVKYIGDHKEAEILDCAAGTGMSGKAIYGAGYKNMTALDGNAGMLEEAKAKGCYKDTLVVYMGHEEIPAPESGGYDVVVMFGALCDGHINSDCFGCFRDIHKVIKPGGFFIAGIVKDCVTPKYKEQVNTAVDALVEQGLYRWMEKGLIPVGDYGEECWVLQKS